jgi:hypothetical protein
MKTVLSLITLGLALSVGTAYAAGHAGAPMSAASAPAAKAGSCADKAAEKKLAGAAKTSFVKKCEKDAKGDAAPSACDTKAADKKLAGAAKTSFVKKCEKDAAAAKK